MSISSRGIKRPFAPSKTEDDSSAISPAAAAASSSSTPLTTSSEAKRARLSHSGGGDNEAGQKIGVLDAIAAVPSTVFNWFSRRFVLRQRGSTTPAASPATESSDQPEEETSEQPIDMGRRRQSEKKAARPPPPEIDLSKDDDDEDDEVQVVDVKLKPPAPALPSSDDHLDTDGPSPLQFGSMSYGPLFQRQKEFRIVTKERRRLDKLSRTPTSILSQVRDSKLTAASAAAGVKKPPSINSFWLQHTTSSQDEDLTKNRRRNRQFPGIKKTWPPKPRTPKFSSQQAFNREDHLKYSAILFGHKGTSAAAAAAAAAFPSSSSLRPTSSIFRSKPKSLFGSSSKKKSSSSSLSFLASGAISVTKFGAERQQQQAADPSPPQEEEGLKKQSSDSPLFKTPFNETPFASLASKPEKAAAAAATSAKSPTLQPPSSHFKPKAIGDPDADVIEIINAYSPPPKAPGAAAVAAAARRSPVSSADVSSGSGSGSSSRCQYKEELELHKVLQDDFLSQLRKKYDYRKEETSRLIREEKVRDKHSHDRVSKLEKNLEERVREHLKVSEVDIPPPPSPPPEEESEEEEEEEEEEEQLPEITSEMEDAIEGALRAGAGQTLVDAHKIAITRKDLETLRGLNWLNDEIINFYLQMVVERSTKNDNWPKVYAMNTFFYPKLMQQGHSALKRWTRKVDIFGHDLIVVPVHLGMHWCLATIDLAKKAVFYYDSMGGNNSQCLSALLKYLEDEHMDKKKTPFDTSGFQAQIVKDIPQQMNGSDCGMFTCKFAEYLSRNAPITFSQENMPYFRRRMIWEIVNNTLLNP